MPRYIKLHEDVKVPVFKNVVYALKLCFKADKWLMLGYIIGLTAEQIFDLFISNILFLKTLLTAIDSHGDFKAYVKYLVLFLLSSAILKVLQWWGYYMSHTATKKVLQKLNNMVFDKATSLDISCYEDPDFYDKYQRATNIMSSGYFDIICFDIALIIANTLTFVCVVSTVASINPVYLLFLLPVLFVFVIELYKSKAVYKRDLEMTKNNRIKAYIQRTVFLKDYSKDVRTSNMFLVLMNRFEAAIRSNVEILRRYGVKLFIYSMISSLFSELIPIIGTYAYAGYEFVAKKSLTVSGFSVVVSSINSIRFATLDFAECFDELSQMALFFENLRTFFDYEPKIVDGTLEAGEFESLEVKNISFKYPTADKKSIDNISFRINKGETVAVVGINGAGKSTLVKLLLRFYDVDEGEILYNGVNIKEYKVESLRNAYATVFQDYKNFAVSVYENVMCRECDDEDKQKARKALEQSGAWEKISTFKKGGDTVLTREFEEDGAGLSGGENQKVSTARLFARDFQIAILDEPSSALDPVAEYKMYENLVDATKDKTVIYISHRLSSAVLSDNIFVLDKGKIVESGTHAALMENCGKYSEMFALQASSYNRKEGEDEHEID
jgi:ATP-binding cassette subfamily B protein